MGRTLQLSAIETIDRNRMRYAQIIIKSQRYRLGLHFLAKTILLSVETGAAKSGTSKGRAIRLTHLQSSSNLSRFPTTNRSFRYRFVLLPSWRPLFQLRDSCRCCLSSLLPLWRVQNATSPAALGEQRTGSVTRMRLEVYPGPNGEQMFGIPYDQIELTALPAGEWREWVLRFIPETSFFGVAGLGQWKSEW